MAARLKEHYKKTVVPALVKEFGYKNVMAVPKIVMNDRVQFEGALPEAQFLEAVVRAASTDGNR